MKQYLTLHQNINHLPSINQDFKTKFEISNTMIKPLQNSLVSYSRSLRY